MAIQVKSEAEAFDLLDRALSGDFDGSEGLPIIEFDGWPHLDVYLPASPVDSSISPTMMLAFQELQKSIYRSYTLVESDTADLRTLSVKEREALEIRVRVSGGSSGFNVDLTAVLEKIGSEAVTKMSGSEIVVTILGLALIIGGTSVLRAWISTRAATRARESETQEKADMLAAQSEVLRQGTEHMRILERALIERPLLADAQAASEDARTQILRSVGEEGGGRIQDAEVSEELASEVTKKARQQSESVRLAGMFFVTKNDTSPADGFKFELTNARTDEVVIATADRIALGEEQVNIIRDAEYGKRAFYAELSAKRLGSRIADAVIQLARTNAPLLDGRSTESS